MSLNMEYEMNESMNKMIMSLLEKAVLKCGEMYNFDGMDALRNMNIRQSVSVKESKSKSKCNVEKVKAKKVSVDKSVSMSSKIPMPYSGMKIEGCCNALRQNHGLYTQCETEVSDDEMYCVKCGPSPQYGTIGERLSVGIMEFRDSKGKAPTSYLKVMKKLKISRSEVEEEAGKKNIIINDIHFVEDKTEKKEKGRPKKAKKIIELEDDSTDLFAALVAKAQEDSSDEEEKENSSSEETSSLAESIVDSVLDNVSKIAENNEKKALKEAEKQKKEAEKEAEKQKKEAEKKKATEKVAEKTKATEKVAEKKKAPEKVGEKNKKNVEEEEEEDVVKRFEFEGVKYLKSKKTGIIYNMEQDVIGKWNEKTCKIDFIEADSEEEEEEYDE